MNKYQNAGENYAFLQCGPCRGYPYLGISQDIRSGSLHMHYQIVVLKNFAKFAGMHMNRSFFSTYNLQLYWKRDIGFIAFCEFCKFFQEHLYYEESLAKWIWK